MTGASLADVDAVLFDAGGVLLLPDPAAFRARLAPFGVAPDDETCRWAHYLSTAEFDRIGRNDYRQADRMVASALGVADADVDAAVEAINLVYTRDPFVPVSGAAEQLRRLGDAGVRMAVVSNATGTVEADLAQHRICAVATADCVAVEAIIDSHVVGVQKPDPAIFTLALERLRLPADRCVYLGDSTYFDITGARSAGMPAVHLTPYEECADGDHEDARSIRAFADRLLQAYA